jgi:hypothetical protein
VIGACDRPGAAAPTPGAQHLDSGGQVGDIRSGGEDHGGSRGRSNFTGNSDKLGRVEGDYQHGDLLNKRGPQLVEQYRESSARLELFDVEVIRRGCFNRLMLDLAAAFGCPTVTAEWLGVAEQIATSAPNNGTGSTNPGDRHVLYHLLRALKPRRLLEIGTHIGGSTLAIAAAMRRNILQDDVHCRLTTVDIKDERGKRKDEDGTLIQYRNRKACPIMDIKFPFYAQLEKFFTEQAMRAVNRIKRQRRLGRAKGSRKKTR